MQNSGILQINKKAGETPGCVRFDKGSGKFPFPDDFLPYIDKIKDSVKNKYFHYPTMGGETDLKNFIVKEELKNSRHLTADNIVVTHGGMSGLFILFSTLFKPGDEIITNNFCFEGFLLLLKHFKLIQKRVDFSDIETVKKAISPNTKAIIFNSPENPTGKVYTKKEIQQLIELAGEHKLWFFSDEVMNRIVYNDIKWEGPVLDNNKVVIINSFSKNWFIPGIRVGWIACKDETAIELFNNFVSLYSVGVNLFSQLFLTEVLSDINYEQFINKYLNILSKRKLLVEKYLNESNIKWLSDVNGGMNYYIDLKKDSHKVSLQLLEKGVAVIPGRLFEGQTSTYARLGFGAVNEEDIKRGIKAISSLLNN